VTNIWVVVQIRSEGIHPMALETLVAGQTLAAELGGSAAAVVLGGDGVTAIAGELTSWDLSAIHVLEDAALAQYTPGAYIGALSAAIGSGTPDYVLFPHTYQSVEYVSRLAYSLDGGMVPEATGFRVENGSVVWRRPVFAGKLQADVRASGNPILASVQSGAYSASDHREGNASVESLAISTEIVADREILGVEEVAGEHVDLSAAERIVSAGRGVGGEDKMGVIHDLAAALGAVVGASRPVIDSGWLPRDCQIGSSGQTVAPKLYVAAGISGAIQHLVGMKGSQVVVAINKDKSAPIFGVADYGIVGDLHEVIPALIEAIQEAQAG
jgi:electron transfer flavoprotein alpha subunit